MKSESISCSVVSDSETPWTVASLSMGFPSKNTGVGCHRLLQGIFLTQGSNLCFLHCRQILYCLSHREANYIWAVNNNMWFLKISQSFFILSLQLHFKIDCIGIISFFLQVGKSKLKEVRYLPEFAVRVTLLGSKPRFLISHFAAYSSFFLFPHLLV